MLICDVEGDEVEEFFVGEFGEFGFGVAALEEGVAEGSFAVYEEVDFFFDGALGDEFVDENVLLLADAEGTVGGLIFDCGVPPAVEVDDVGGGGEGEAGTAGFEGEDEERGPVFALKGIDKLFALDDGGASVEDEAGAAEDGGEVGGEVIGHLAELGEDEDLFLTGGNFFAELAEAVELATVFGRVFIIS